MPSKTTTKNTTKKKGVKKTVGVGKKTGVKKTVAQPSGQASTARRIDRLIAETGGWKGERLAEIRRLIHEVDPEVVEEWKWMGTPVWSHEGMYANANPFKDKVKVTFHHGAQLRDPGKLFNAGLEGNKWRAIDIYEGDRIDKPKFKALLREAIAYNETHAVPKSRGSKA